MHTKLILLIGACFAVGALGHTVLQLDPEFTVMFHMTSVTNRIEIQVTANTTGWVGFGFSQTANFADADLVIGGVNGTYNNTVYFGVSNRGSSSKRLSKLNIKILRIIGRQLVLHFQH